jgi:pimeloyl-ACP methyl ester carboxylesterase
MSISGITVRRGKLQKQTRSITSKNLKLVYDSYGSGPDAVVYIHGWTCSRALWSYQSPLYTSYRSILIDLPGHGESDKPLVDYNREFLARSVKAVIDVEDISRAILVAHSMGGPVATMLLRLFPDQVTGIVYLDSFWQMPETYLNNEERAQLSREREDDATFTKTVEDMFERMTASTTKDAVLQVMMATPKHVRLSACCTGSHPHALAWDKTFPVPALHLADQGAWQDGYWKHHMPNLEVRKFAKLGHFLHMMDPEAINAEIDEFIVQCNVFPL